MNKQFSIAEAKNKLPAIVHEVEKGSTATLTRHGKPVAVLLSLDEFQAQRHNKPDFATALRLFLANPITSENGIDDDFLAGLRDRSAGRETDL